MPPPAPGCLRIVFTEGAAPGASGQRNVLVIELLCLRERLLVLIISDGIASSLLRPSSFSRSRGSDGTLPTAA